MKEATLNLPFSSFKYFIFIIIVIVALLGSFYTIQVEEKGVVKRFGKYIYTTGPGLHFKFPFGVDEVIKIKTERVFKEEFGFRALKSGIKTTYTSDRHLNESLMLTGDLNIVVVEWVVQYKISNPEHFLFNIRDKLKNIRDLSESVMRLIVGDRSVDEVLTVGREEIEYKVKEKLQQVLDLYKSGIKIVTLKLLNVNPPQTVRPSFNDVNKAKQDKERLINEAYREYNKNIPLAAGQKDNLISKAKGYAVERINKAKGDAAKFNMILNEYKKAPEITKKRIYLEEMEKILSRVREIKIISEKLKSIYPILNLDNKGVGIK